MEELNTVIDNELMVKLKSLSIREHRVIIVPPIVGMSKMFNNVFSITFIFFVIRTGFEPAYPHKGSPYRASPMCYLTMVLPTRIELVSHP